MPLRITLQESGELSLTFTSSKSYESMGPTKPLAHNRRKQSAEMFYMIAFIAGLCEAPAGGAVRLRRT